MAAGEKQKISLAKLPLMYKLRLNFTINGKTASEVMFNTIPLKKCFELCYNMMGCAPFSEVHL